MQRAITVTLDEEALDILDKLQKNYVALADKDELHIIKLGLKVVLQVGITSA